MIELHLHIDGSIRPSTALELARELGIASSDDTVESFTPQLTAPQKCASLNEYLDRFAIPLQLVRSNDALIRITRELVTDLADEGTEIAELRFAPNSSVCEGSTQRSACEAVLEGVHQGMKLRPGIDARIILCCMRGIDPANNLETIRLAHEFKGTRIRGADLAGAEAIFPTRDYIEIFREASALKVPFTIHAGEAAGPESIRTAIAMGARRIGHGVRAIEDPELVRMMAEEGITAEVCMTSNLQTGICHEYREHPVRKLFDAGIRVTFSSDNRTVSGTTLKKELDIARSMIGFSEEEIALTQRFAREALL